MVTAAVAAAGAPRLPATDRERPPPPWACDSAAFGPLCLGDCRRHVQPFDGLGVSVWKYVFYEKWKRKVACAALCETAGVNRPDDFAAGHGKACRIQHYGSRVRLDCATAVSSVLQAAAHAIASKPP